MTTRMRRAVGYCEVTDCEDYAKGVFLLNHGDTFYCPRCRELGTVVPERGHFVGNSNVFKEVRVEFDYCAVNRKFKSIAVIRDESLWGTRNVYTLNSPLIRTEKRALKVAEAILSNLNKYGMLAFGDGGIPSTMETIISLDQPVEELKKKLDTMAEELAESSLRRL